MKRLSEKHSFTLQFPDGTQHVIKSSDHAYTHAVITEFCDEESAKWRRGRKWGVFSHHTSEALAIKKRNWIWGWSAASSMPYKQVLIVPVAMGEEIR